MLGKVVCTGTSVPHSWGVNQGFLLLSQTLIIPYTHQLTLRLVDHQLTVSPALIVLELPLLMLALQMLGRAALAMDSLMMRWMVVAAKYVTVWLAVHKSM